MNRTETKNNFIKELESVHEGGKGYSLLDVVWATEGYVLDTDLSKVNFKHHNADTLMELCDNDIMSVADEVSKATDKGNYIFHEEYIRMQDDCEGTLYTISTRDLEDMLLDNIDEIADALTEILEYADTNVLEEL